MKKTFFILISVCLLAYNLNAQEQYTTASEILKSIEARQINNDNSIFIEYPVRNVGPVVQGGRITDIAVNEKNTKEFYIAFASGGVFKTNNNGISFYPVFDNIGTLTIGDICLAPSDDNILWVGTGENNSSRSSYTGSGVYKSVDGGNTWECMGLESTQHIGRIVIHPENPEIVWVAATGNLYTHSPDRGIFMTKDGGKTWDKTLYVNDSTGAIDLVIHPGDPDMLWASMWERTRKAWNFKGHGPGSAIYRSTNGGVDWEKAMTGIQDTEHTGRIGLDVCKSKPNILYALIDNQMETKSEKKRENGEIMAADFISMTMEQLLDLEDEKLNEFLKNNYFPEKYNADVVKEEIKAGKYTPKAIAEYLGDANSALFDTKVKGAEVYKSEDFGDTWKKTHDYWLDGVYFTYGYYFGEVRVSPSDANRIYIFGVPLLRSDDGGQNFTRADTIGDVHADHHAMWINPNDPDHIILGNDGGLYMSYDGGAAWNHINNIPAGQFYTVNYDMEKPYNIYGGLQDNGILFGSSRSVPNETDHWEYLFGGDGMFVIPDPRDHNLVYVGYQFGNYYRINTKTNERKYITPRPDIGEPRLRFNWRTPVLMSAHNSDIIYLGANKLYRSMNKGDTWTTISEDLTRNLPNGNVPYSTLTCVSESTLKFGLLYIGTDDGNIHVSKDGGNSWELISRTLPQNKWVTGIHTSSIDEGTVFVSLTGYRNDDFKTYVFRSDDYGESWNNIDGNIHLEAVNIILQDPVVPNLLFLGTDHGTYISVDAGERWDIISQIPNVASYDLAIHPRAHDLIVGTHGRSIFVVPLEPIRKIADSDKEFAFKVFETEKVRFSKRWGEKRYPYLKAYQPESEIMYYVEDNSEDITFEVLKEETTYLKQKIKAAVNGFNTFKWSLRVHPLKDNGKPDTKELTFVEKGTYTLRFTCKDQIEEITLEVE
jgi:photosystem II stability/assembly factor-like uncharacterized protein